MNADPDSDPALAALLAAVPGAVPPALELYIRSHRDPELSGAEKATAARLADRLAATGLEVTRGVGGHGVVAVLRNGSGPVVMLRTELDALPVREQTGLPYASTATALDATGREVPVMHACGHDLHLACVAGAAEILTKQRRHWQGTLMVVGQPAEETLSGAESMLADGLYERFDVPAAVLAQHCAPLPAGMIAHSHGPVTAASASLHVVVHGKGGHASSPHLTVDPVVTAAAIVLRLQNIVARETSPADQAAVTVGAIHAGEARTANIIPDRATLDITIRALSQDTLERALASVHRIIAAECDAAGSGRRPDITLISKSPANVPDPTLAAAVRRSHQEAFGPQRVTHWPASLAAEDFPLFGPAGARLHGKAGIRTAYWMLGVVGAAQWSATPGASAAEKLTALPPNHAPEFRPDPRLSIPAGITALVAAFLAGLR